MEYTRIVNELLKSHWESYSHCTCSLIGYVAAILQETKGGEMVLKSEVEGFIIRMRSGERNVEEDVNRLFGDDTALQRMFRWDSQSGDCSTGHFMFKERLERDSRLTMVKWQILV